MQNRTHNPNRRERPYDNSDDRQLFDDTFSVASSMECTGLIPAAPDSTEEVDSYSEIYDIPLSKNAKAADNNLEDVHKTDLSRFH